MNDIEDSGMELELEKILLNIKERLLNETGSKTIDELLQKMPGVSKNTLKNLMGTNGTRKTKNTKGCSMSTLFSVACGLNVPVQLFFKSKKGKGFVEYDYSKLTYEDFPNAWNVFIKNIEVCTARRKHVGDEPAYNKVLGGKRQRRRKVKDSGIESKQNYGKTMNVRLINVLRIMNWADEDKARVKWFERWPGIVYDDEMEWLNQYAPFLAYGDGLDMVAIRTGSLEEMVRLYSSKEGTDITLQSTDEWFGGSTMNCEEETPDDSDWNIVDMLDLDVEVDGFMPYASFKNGNFRIDNWGQLFSRGVVHHGDLLLRCFFFNEIEDELHEYILNLTRPSETCWTILTESGMPSENKRNIVISKGNHRLYKVDTTDESSAESLIMDPFRVFHGFDSEMVEEGLKDSVRKGENRNKYLFECTPNDVVCNFLKETNPMEKLFKMYRAYNLVSRRFREIRSNSDSEMSTITVKFSEWYRPEENRLEFHRDEKTIQMVTFFSEAYDIRVLWSYDNLLNGVMSKLDRVMGSLGFSKNFRKSYLREIEQKGIYWLIASGRIWLEVHVPSDVSKDLEWYWKIELLIPKDNSKYHK